MLGARGIRPTPAQVDVTREYLLQVEQAGVHHTREPAIVRQIFDDITAAHVAGFRLAFAASAGVALLGAALTLLLVRRDVPVGVPIRLAVLAGCSQPSANSASSRRSYALSELLEQST